jgi:hypothetical protein
MALCSPDMRGVLAVGILSRLRLTLTRFVAAGDDVPSILAPLEGLTDLELPMIESCSDTAL